jgi:ATP-dependent DNA helicase RecG
MGLVERSGVGVDRMYREMVSLGHRPPTIREEAGPRIRCRLVGGRPLLSVLAVTAGLEPAARRRDVRVALTLYAVLRDGYVTPGTLAVLLQVPVGEAEEAFDAVAECELNGTPVLRATIHGVHLPGATLTRLATADDQALAIAKRRGLLTWWRPDASAAERLVTGYLAAVGRISSGDIAEITGLSNPAALHLLRRLEAAGTITRGGPVARGRNAHFVAAAAPTAPNSPRT